MSFWCLLQGSLEKQLSSIALAMKRAGAVAPPAPKPEKERAAPIRQSSRQVTQVKSVNNADIAAPGRLKTCQW